MSCIIIGTQTGLTAHPRPHVQLYMYPLTHLPTHRYDDENPYDVNKMAGEENDDGNSQHNTARHSMAWHCTA